MLVKKLAAIVAGVMIVGSAAASTTAKDTSTVSLGISANQLQVVGLDDLTINYDLKNAEKALFESSKDSKFCVFRSGHGQGGYTLGLKLNEGDDAALTLKNGDESVPYKVLFQGGGQKITLSKAGRLDVTFSKNSLALTDDDCDDAASNASVNVQVTKDDIVAAKAGNYTDTLTFLFAAN